MRVERRPDRIPTPVCFCMVCRVAFATSKPSIQYTHTHTSPSLSHRIMACQQGTLQAHTISQTHSTFTHISKLNTPCLYEQTLSSPAAPLPAPCAAAHPNIQCLVKTLLVSTATSSHEQARGSQLSAPRQQSSINPHLPRHRVTWSRGSPPVDNGDDALSQ